MVLNESIISKEGRVEKYHCFPCKKQFTFKSIRCTHIWGAYVIFQNLRGSPRHVQSRAGMQQCHPHGAHSEVSAAGDLPGPSCADKSFP